jgi:hypothetical protein
MRIAFPGPEARLFVCGPGQLRVEYSCADLEDCVDRQAQIHRGFVEEGYQLLAGNRRSGRDRRTVSRPGPDRRRDLAEVDGVITG